MEELILLKSRIKKLIDAYGKLEEELATVRTENQELSNRLNENDSEVSRLKKEFYRVELSGAILGEGDESHVARKRINDLVREIDNCIALLNNI